MARNSHGKFSGNKPLFSYPLTLTFNINLPREVLEL